MAAMSCHVRPRGEWGGVGGWVGGVCNWARAKKVLLRPQAYVAMWRQAAQGGKKKKEISVSGLLFRNPALFVAKSAT